MTIGVIEGPIGYLCTAQLTSGDLQLMCTVFSKDKITDPETFMRILESMLSGSDLVDAKILSGFVANYVLSSATRIADTPKIRLLVGGIDSCVSAFCTGQDGVSIELRFPLLSNPAQSLRQLISSCKGLITDTWLEAC